MPKVTPAINETPKAKSSTGMEDDALMGMPAKPPPRRRKLEVQNKARPRKCNHQTGHATRYREQNAFGEGLPLKPGRLRPRVLSSTIFPAAAPCRGRASDWRRWRRQ